MYARMTVAQTIADQFDAAVQIVQEHIVPAAREQPGYGGFLLLTDHSRQQLIGISLWESEADLQSSAGMSGYYRQQMAAFGDLLAASPTTTVHEVIVREP